MGIYTTYGNVQIKIDNDKKSNPLKQYIIRDKVPIDDGVYIGREGIIVIKDHIFIAEFNDMKNKYGKSFTYNDIIFKKK